MSAQNPDGPNPDPRDSPAHPSPTPGVEATDAGASEAGTTDAGATEAGATEAGTTGTGATEAGDQNVGSAKAGPANAGASGPARSASENSDNHPRWRGRGRRWHYRRSLASRIGLLTVMAVGVSVTFMAIGSIIVMRHQLQQGMDSSLMARAKQTAASFQLTGAVTKADLFYPATEVQVQVFTADGQWFVLGAGSSGEAATLNAQDYEVLQGKRASNLHTTYDVYRTPYRMATVPLSKGGGLVVAQPMTSLQRDMKHVTLVLIFFGAMGIVMAAPAGWMVARSSLRPVRRLTSSVERIARTEDLTPVRVEGADELARLGTAFNQMLQALAASRERQRRMIADASHELRTPLTSLRTNMELLRQADRSGGLPEQARRELLDDVSAQIEELSSLVQDLVELNRDEQVEKSLETLAFADTVSEAIARVRRRAPSDLVFDVELQPWTVFGEPQSLERAVLNLLDNAVKWSPADGRVTITLVGGVLTVDDEGPGISETDLPHVFDRFYRSDESRAMPGSGLGLSIVRQTVERHAGAVRAGRSPAGGARLQMWIPSA